MAIVLNIDTAISSASVCLSQEMRSLQFASNADQKDQASWLHVAIERVIEQAGLAMTDLDAVAVTIGPGSYTGLRVGLSAAKGLCFALNIPLISINTLELIADSMRSEETDFFCPVIDARRMEVFTAVYDKHFAAILQPCAMIVEKNSFDALLSLGRIIFSGNAVEKMEKIIVHSNAVFKNSTVSAVDMVRISANNFLQKKFADIAYTEPFYIKEFYSTAR